jgi:hypothetical protein
MRANPKTFCTKWLEQSDAMTDEDHTAMDADSSAKREFYRNETETERKARQAKMDTAIYAPRGNASFSIFADTSRDPR